MHPSLRLGYPTGGVGTWSGKDLCDGALQSILG